MNDYSPAKEPQRGPVIPAADRPAYAIANLITCVALLTEHLTTAALIALGVAVTIITRRIRRRTRS